MTVPCKITVFTPTYNRGYIIRKLYDSLKRQRYFDFEWLVIDDGSLDDTTAIFDQIIADENRFPIRYYKVENGGKHRAINKAVDLAAGEFFFIVDSDDYLTDNALERIAYWVDTINEDPRLCGIAGLRGYTDKELIGESFSGEYIDATALEREKHKIGGDKAEVIRTEVLKKHKFKEFDGENFLTENTVWYEIAGAGHAFRWVNEIIYICNYLDDGLTRNLQAIIKNNLEGFIYQTQVYKTYNKLGLKGRLSHYGIIYKHARAAEKDVKAIAKRLKVSVCTLKFAAFLRKLFARR